MNDGIKYISRSEYNRLVKEHSYVNEKELIDMIGSVMCKGGTAFVKYICQYCGTEQQSAEPNTLHTGGYICEVCSELSKPRKYGLIVVFIKPDMNMIKDLLTKGV